MLSVLFSETFVDYQPPEGFRNHLENYLFQTFFN